MAYIDSGFKNLLNNYQNKRLQKDRQIFGSSHRAKQTLEYEGDCDTTCNWRTLNGFQRLGGKRK